MGVPLKNDRFRLWQAYAMLAKSVSPNGLADGRIGRLADHPAIRQSDNPPISSVTFNRDLTG
jgi:hypothetical protein